MSNQQGMILLNTLLMISLLALMTLSQLQLFFLQLKATNQLLFEKKIVQQLEMSAGILLAAKTVKKECLIPMINANKVIKRLQRQEGCLTIINNKPYRFMIEDAGIFPCLKIRVANQVYASRHQRLTIMTDDTHHSLQWRIAKIAPDESCEQPASVVIKPSVISWRYLDE